MSAPTKAEARRILRDAVAAAVMAPSSHNTQPWRFRIVGSTLEVLTDDLRQLPVIDRERRQLVVSCGCALFNARVAVRAMGYTDEVIMRLGDQAQPELIATLHLGPRIVPSEIDLALMRALPLRRTNRRPFLPRPVAAAETDALIATAAALGAWMVRLLPPQKAELAGLINQADHVQYGDPAFRTELASWLTPLTSHRRDGIPFVEKEYGSALPFAVMRALRSPGLGDEVGQLEEERILGAPVVVVLGTADDGPADWLACGQALEAVLLHATRTGKSAAFLNQVLELPDLRSRVAALAGRPGAPQMVLRLGYPEDPVLQPAPRRELEDVLVVAD